LQKPVLEAIRHSIPFRLYQDQSGAKESLLYNLCVKYGQSSYENPRDKIFGLQSITKACCRNASPINYLAYTLDICYDLLRHAISHYSILGDLQIAKRQAYELRKALNIPQFSINTCESFIGSLSFYKLIEIESKSLTFELSQPLTPIESISYSRSLLLKLDARRAVQLEIESNSSTFEPIGIEPKLLTLSQPSTPVNLLTIEFQGIKGSKQSRSV
jgi:hypothetical protein